MNQPPRKILISGASGLIGGALRHTLTTRGSEVIGLVRRIPEAAEIRWEPNSPNPFPNPDRLEGFNAVIHLSGADLSARRWTQTYKREIVSSRVNSTRVLSSALARAKDPPQTLLVASAIGIYGNRGNQLLDESSASGSGFLAQTCAAWEAAAKPATDAGIRVVHLRFGVVLARHGGALARMLPLFQLGLGGRLGNGNQWMSWIGLPDLVSSILFAFGTPGLSGALNLTTPNPITNAQFTHALATQLHRPAMLPAPAFALRIAFGEMADDALLSSARVYPRRLVDAGFTFANPTIEGALAAALA